ncbi:LacI family transcriptional regulator [Conyzicola lurida]|uniref:LacI family transcriptional regulator n=1 Tax=Conyzicola lurida TaxID=1172621 RepID=A0A841AR85_9MICO|nr:LacI family transcriptional regulator [Conyzicola lurida]
MSSIKDVAALAGVSMSTVSNVLNRPERVSADSVDRVLRAIDQLGFVRNDAARQLRTGRSTLIGLAVINISNPFFTDVATGVEQAARDAGYSVLLGNSASRPEGEVGFLDLFEKQRVDGVLIVPSGDVLDKLDGLRRRGTPAVLIDRVDDRRTFSSVSTDDVVGGRLAGEHLLAIGRRRIWFIGADLGVRQMRDRLDGLREAVRAVPGATVSVEISAHLNAEDGIAYGRRIAALPAAERPDAVFAANDMVALGLLQAFTGSGIRVPHDIAIVGYDDIVFSAAAAIPLTSVRQPSQRMGSTAATLLIDQLAGDAEHRSIVYEPELVVRSSTAG